MRRSATFRETTTPAELVLEHLRAIRADVADAARSLGEVRQRVANLEGMMANLVTQDATVFARPDAMADDLARIRERRVLIEAWPARAPSAPAAR